MPDGTSAPATTIADVSLLTDPKDAYKSLRDEPGLHFDPKLGAYLVSRYDDLQAVLADPITFSLEKAWSGLWSEEFRAILERDGGGFFPDAIMTDPPNHTRVRRLIEKAFTPHRIKQLEPKLSAQAAEVIESVADRGQADSINEIAIPTTIRIMAAQLGMKDVDLATIDRWSTALTAQIGRMVTPGQMAENAKIVCDCQHFIIDMIRSRQANPTEDLISDLVYARTEDGENPVLSFGEIVASARAFLLGGTDSISTAIGHMLYTLATRPDIAQSLQASLDDDRPLNRFVEELVRIAPPAQATARIVTRDTELAGQHLPAGTLVMTMFASANDDETHFTNPREFDADRPNLISHMAYGAGIHKCVGMALARMELKVVARETLRRLKDLRLAVPPEQIPYRVNVSMRSIDKLPLTFSRRA